MLENPLSQDAWDTSEPRERFDYWTTYESAINTSLHSLPPSYRDIIHGYVGRGESLQFFEFMVNLRDVEFEPIEGEIVDGEGIYLIYLL